MARDHFQIWALLCKDDSNLVYLQEAYQELKRAGVAFPSPPRNINTVMTKTRSVTILYNLVLNPF